MTSAEDTAIAVIRAYADTLQPPPVQEVIDRPAPAPPVGARRLALVAAATTVVAVIVAAFALDRPPDRGTIAAVVPSPSASRQVAGMQPACPPFLPVLDKSPFVSTGRAPKPRAVQAGQRLTLKARIPAMPSDRRLLSFAIYLGRGTTEPDLAVAHSPVQQLTPDQRSVSVVLQLPTGLAPGTYYLIGWATWPGPSICGLPNPADSTMIGTASGGIGAIVVR